MHTSEAPKQAPVAAGSGRILVDQCEPERLRATLSKRASYRLFKRAVDLAAVLVAGPAVLIIVFLAAMAVWFSMGRPVFFVQERVGIGGRTFRMLKIRTMLAGDKRDLAATARQDPRITTLGRILRRSRIDELPQLWNIFVGDMTFIGPRPEQTHLVEHYSKFIPNYRARHFVTPGLTGWSQVCYGYASNLEETKHKTEYDLFYVENLNLKLDCFIVLRTLYIFAKAEFAR